MSMYTSGIMKILFPAPINSDREAFFGVAEEAGYRTVAWNSQVFVHVPLPTGGSIWHCTTFEVHDFRVTVDTE